MCAVSPFGFEYRRKICLHTCKDRKISRHIKLVITRGQGFIFFCLLYFEIYICDRHFISIKILAVCNICYNIIIMQIV